jgi:NarL family two-component system sensor histidine kinase LiaS
MREKLKRLSGSLTARLFLSHVLVAVLTGAIVALILLTILNQSAQNLTLDTYRGMVPGYVAYWLIGQPDGEPTDLTIDPMPGWTLILSDTDEVLWSRGSTPCRAGMQLADCLPPEDVRPEGDSFFERNGERWAQVSVPLQVGGRALAQRGEFTFEPLASYGDIIVRGYDDLIVFEVLTRGAIAIPIALVLAGLITRPQIRRLSAITQASRRFASGDLEARVGDPGGDEVARLGQQFDDMAGALAQNIHALHDLAQRNAELALQAEQAAIKAERSRISRDLHDAIAQRLFSLSVSTTTLPDLIAQSPERGIQQAKAIAELAEQTLLDLRSLLMDLRPTSLVQHGLAESLTLLFRQWQSIHSAHIEPALMLTGRHIPAAIEDAVYQITQEALSNVARHADASLVELSLVEGQQQLLLSISDNGAGFDTEAPPASAKFGLISMRERAQMFGGKLDIESILGKGTTIQVSLPLAESV